MAQLKMLKLPKKPKADASIAALENWLKKAEEVRRENAHRKQLNHKHEALRKKVAGIGSTYATSGGATHRHATKKAAPKKAVKKAVRKTAHKKHHHKRY